MNNIVIREYKESDIKAMVEIWNEVVEDGVAFPQIDGLTEESGKEFFAQQSYCGVAEDEETNTVLGMYILHPNNIGRCGHISNASYAVSSKCRGLHIGEKLVKIVYQMREDWALIYYSLMQLWQAMFTQDIYTKE